MLQDSKDAAKAVQALRSDKTLTAMTYADYLKSKGYATRNSSSNSSRPLPQTIARDRTGDPTSSSSTVAATASVPAAAETLKVVQDLREAVAAKKQAQQAKAIQQQQQQQQQQQDAEAAADSDGTQLLASAVAAATVGQNQNSGAPDKVEFPTSSSSSSSSEVVGSSSSSSSGGDGSSAAQQRLKALQQLSRPSRPGPALQRPAVRPTFPPSNNGQTK
jgi:hypothetical protein